MADKHNPPNHSPPKHILDLVNTKIDVSYDQDTVGMGHPLINPTFTYHDSFKEESYDYIPQMPFE